MDAKITTDDALLLSAVSVCERIGIGLSHFHAMRRTGKLPLRPIRLGRAVRFNAGELARWVAAGCPAADRWKMLEHVG